MGKTQYCKSQLPKHSQLKLARKVAITACLFNMFFVDMATVPILTPFAYLENIFVFAFSSQTADSHH